MIVLGLLLGLVGLDITSGAERFTFGLPDLNDGLGFVPVAMGLFGLAEIMANLDGDDAQGGTMQPIRSLLPTREDFRRAAPAAARGTLIGALLGVLPGGGATLSSFAAYAVEKKVSRRPEEFGHGAIEGVAGPESANNAAAQTSFIPLLTLGIPGNAVMAVMMGAMMIQGIAPGPQVMNTHPQLFWGVIASMWIGNLMLVILNLPLIGIWVRLLKVPYHYLFPAILVFSAIGVYSVGESVFDVYVAVAFGFLGYFFRKVGCEPAPLVLGFILGPLMEENLRRALLLSRGDPMTFIDKPLSAGLFIAALVLLIAMIAPALRRRRAEAFIGD
jgi:TctA family transporter